jgi:hypothetical protein
MKEVIIRFKNGEQIRFKCKDAKLTNTLVVKHDDGFIRTYFTDDNWSVDVLAEDEVHARKIGIDYIMQAKYMEE